MAKTNEIRSYLGLDLTKFQKGLKKAENKLYRTMRKLDNIGQSMTRTITAPVIAFGAASIKSAADIDKLRKGLEGIMGDSAAAAKEFNKLRKMARNPGLDLKSAVQGSIKLQSIGFSADDARKSMSSLANAIALVGGTGEDLAGVNLAITQIIGKGKVQAEEINQIAERLPQVRQAMIKAFGSADTEVLQKMQLDAREFVDGIVNELGELPKAKASISDSLNNLRDDFQVLAASIGVKLFPIFNKLMGVVLKIVNAFTSLSSAQQDSYIKWGLIAAAAGPAAIALSHVVGVVHKLTKALMTGSLLNPYVAAIAAMAAAVYLVVTNWDLVKVKIVEAQNKFAEFYNSSELFRNFTDSLVSAFTIIYENIKMSLRGLKDMLMMAKAAASLDFSEVANIWTEGTKLNEEGYKNIEEAQKKLIGAMTGTNPFEKIEPIDASDVDAAVAPLLEKIKYLQGLIANLLNGGIGGGSGGGGREQVATGGMRPLEMGKVATGRLDSFKIVVPEVDLSKYKEGLNRLVDVTHVTFGKVAKTMKETFDDVLSQVSQVFGAMSGVIDQFYENKYARIEKDYETSKKFIENGIMSEENRATLMTELEEDRAKKVAVIKRKEAKANKARAIFDSILNTANAVSSALAMGPAGIPLAAVMGALGAAQTAMIAAQPIPALAKGGLATGPTYAMVGDNKNAKVDPEVIAPLSKLKGMLNTGQNITVGGAIDIHGDALRMVLERADYDHTRRTGYGRAV